MNFSPTLFVPATGAFRLRARKLAPRFFSCTKRRIVDNRGLEPLVRPLSLAGLYLVSLFQSIAIGSFPTTSLFTSYFPGGG